MTKVILLLAILGINLSGIAKELILNSSGPVEIISIHYPMGCNAEIVTDGGDISELFDVLHFTLDSEGNHPMPGVSFDDQNNSIFMDLSRRWNLHMFQFYIKTEDGQNIGEVIRNKLGPKATVKLISCDGLEN